MRTNWFLFLFSCFVLGLFSVQEFQLKFPDYFPKTSYNFKSNPLDSSKISLGRSLFYDPILSLDNQVSCASCHSSYNAFAHTDHDLSHGINDQIGTRNAPALFNLAWQKSFMWDGSIQQLDFQALAPISHPKEMGEELIHVISKLQATKEYPRLFYKAFGDSIITGEFVLKALTQFQLTLVSANSKYDAVRQGKTTFNAQEKRGYELVKKNCSSCHTEPLFSSYEFGSNGLTIDSTLMDYGKFLITNHPADRFLFKIPSLRNLAYTYPYMHDGRFQHLNEVLTHYTSQVNVNSKSKNSLQGTIQLTSNEKVDILAFLKTLNDEHFVFNPDFQFPKNKKIE